MDVVNKKNNEFRYTGCLDYRNKLKTYLRTELGINITDFIKDIINEFLDNPIWIEKKSLDPFTFELLDYYNAKLVVPDKVVGACPIINCDFVGSLRMLYIHLYNRHGAHCGIIVVLTQ